MKSKTILVVGGGLAGCACARMLADIGYTVFIREKYKYLGGICRDQRIDACNCYYHNYGIHCFHTKHKFIWDFVNRFDKFNDFHLQQMSKFEGKYYHFPINFNTIEEVFGVEVNSKREADALLKTQIYYNETNLEACAINDIGPKLYEMFIKPYTEKQWQTTCDKLPPFIYKRVGIRYNRDNDLFQNQYQGLPDRGYLNWINYLATHPNIHVELNSNYDNTDASEDSKYDYVIYTGAIADLPYRCTMFISDIGFKDSVYPLVSLSDDKYFIRYVDFSVMHKVIQGRDSETHMGVYELPLKTNSSTPLYPINTDYNNRLYEEKKKEYLSKHQNTILAGRLATYKYLNMDDTIYQCYQILVNNKLIPENYFEQKY